MPTYEYECTKCNHAFEEESPITAPARQRCPRCRGRVKRLVSGGSGIVFKGPGFYATDSRPKPAAAAKTGADATPGPGAKPATATHDTKSPPADKK